MVAAGVLVIGLMLLLAGISGPDGRVRDPGLAGYVYIIAVAGVAACVLFVEPTGHTARSSREHRTGQS